MEPDTVELCPCGDFVADCPAHAATNLFANAWLPVVVFERRTGPLRPGQLHRSTLNSAHVDPGDEDRP